MAGQENSWGRSFVVCVRAGPNSPTTKIIRISAFIQHFSLVSKTFNGLYKRTGAHHYYLFFFKFSSLICFHGTSSLCLSPKLIMATVWIDQPQCMRKREQQF